MQLKRRSFGDHFRVAQQLLDRRKEQRRSRGELPRDLARLRQALTLGNDMIGESPMLGFRRVHPATGHQELDRHVIGDPAPQLDRARIGEHANVDLGQSESRVLLHDDDVRAEHDLEAAAAGYAIDCRDEGLVEVARIVKTAEAADAPVRIGLFAGGGGLQVPARGEEALTGAGDDRDPQLRVVAKAR